MTRSFHRFLAPAATATLAALCLLTAPAHAGASIVPGNMAKAERSTGESDLLASLSARPSSSRLTAPADAAHDFVRFSGASKNLSLLLLHDVKNDTYVRAAIKRYGFAHVQDTVVRAIKKAQASYGTRWSDMLASIYDERFEDGELKSILREKESSPHFIKLLSEQDNIATDVREKGEGIFASARAQVMETLNSDLKI